MTALLAASPAPVLPADSTRVYSGRQRQLDVRPPRLDGEVVIDGVLDEPQWAKSALLTGFSQYAPSDGAPAADSTQVLVWYSATAIYFGVRAYESHGAVRPNLADRDHIDAEDRVEFLLSTFNDGRQALVFQVNPLGIQADGTLVESGKTSSTSTSSSGNAAGREAPDLSADFVFQSKGRVTSYGYEVEVRIPFSSIRYQNRDPQTWGFNVTRHVQHSGYDDSWAPARRDAASFLAQSGSLTGLTHISHGLVLDVNPEITQSVAGSPTAASGWQYRADHTNLGGNVRWGVTNDLTLNATVKPDFSQVEADADQVTYDPRQALFYPERRPFFLDGIEQFAVPNNLIYTRTIVQPTAAGKLTGSVAGTAVALLTAADDPSTSVSGNDHPLFNILRAQRDLGNGSRIGALLTDREDGSDYNRVGGLDARLVRGIYTIQLQGVASATDTSRVPFSGPLWAAQIQRQGRTFSLDYNITGISPSFVTQSGFVSRNGIVVANLIHRLTYLGTPESLLENLTGAVSLIGDWQYATFMRHGDFEDKKLHFDINASFRGGWSAGAGLYTEVFGYDPTIYADYRILAPPLASGLSPDTLPYTGTRRIPNHDYILSFATPNWSQFSANGFFLFGQDENFFEWAQASIYLVNYSMDWRPTPQVRLNATYIRQQYDRRTDGSVVGLRQIPRVKLEYQVSRPVFLRLVAQYDSQHQATLRDETRTDYPILLYDPSTGTYSPASAFVNNSISTQALFAYQPAPGTVFFVGYGSLLAEPQTFRLDHLDRQSDGFFVKMSYVFRAH